MCLALRALAVSLPLLALAGCRLVEPQAAGKSPLRPLTVAPEAITLEVFTAPAPRDDPEFSNLWSLVDEQPLPADLRRRLAANGIRAGLLGPSVPSALAQVLKISGRRVADEARQQVNLDAEGGVKLRVLHVQAGKRNELAIPRVRDELTLLESTGGQVLGRSYRKAECQLALRAAHQADTRVRLELTPELCHGEFRSRRRGSDGVFIMTQERDKKVFDELRLQPALAAGQMLLVTRRPDSASTAGHHFFTDEAPDRAVAVLWVIRVADAAPDRAFYDGPEEGEPEPVSNDLVEAP